MTPNQRQLFDYLRTKRSGDLVSAEEILRETRWATSTLKTYRSKHYIDPFLSYSRVGRYRVLRNGNEISEKDITSAFTQVRPGIFAPTEGMELHGTHDTYELKAHLGNGAVGHVWRCKMRGNGAERAAKLLNPREDLLNPKVIENVRKRFSREARNGSGLSHPNLVAYRDYGELGDHPFLIMDLADTSIATVLKTGPLSLATSVKVIQSCLSGLEYLHGLGCVHRDVKPANILQIGTRFMLGDLGIVNWSDMNPAFTSAGTITRDSLQLGSWYYMAPEQRRMPHQVQSSGDVYALGVSWYEMLTQTTPDPADVAAKHFGPATTNTDIEQIIRRMMSFNPAERPSVRELLDAAQNMRLGECSLDGSVDNARRS